MFADSPSQTAMAAAFLRALHLVVDDHPYVFEDRLAVDFLPEPQRRFLRRLAALPRPWLGIFRQRRGALGRMRAQILVRSRYAEDALQAAGEDGAGRYLILAAGLDTFAWRQEAAAPESPIPVLEVDHPATQRWKQRTLERRGQPVPSDLTLVPIDFERQPLSDVVSTLEVPQFVSWLGTSYYLSRRAMTATLTALAAACAPGSRLVLDYWQQHPFGSDAALLWGTRLATAAQLEPMRNFLDPSGMADLARQGGWQVREHLDAATQNARYLAGRRDDLAVPGFAHLVLLER